MSLQFNFPLFVHPSRNFQHTELTFSTLAVILSVRNPSGMDLH